MRKRGNRAPAARVTMQDVAAQAGVSQMTVSRVLRGDSRVRGKTRERVRAAIAELNYKPNAFARGLASARSSLIALLTHEDPRCYYFSDLLVGAMNEAQANGYNIVVENCGLDPGRKDMSIFERLDRLDIDGIIVPERISNYPWVMEGVGQLDVPHVRISSVAGPADSPNVTVDYRRAAYDMTRYLLDQGHTAIAFIKGDVFERSAVLRYEGYCDALRDNGIALNEPYIKAGSFGLESGYEIAMELLALPDVPSAIFASNDLMAFGVLSAAARLNFAVPDDVAVAGFDNVYQTELAIPKLTTIDHHAVETGRVAAEVLLQIIHDPSLLERRTPLTRMVDHGLVIRDSVAALRQQR